MGSDSLTALGLGTEKPVPRVMQRPPRSQGERLLNSPLALRAYLFLGPIEAAAAMAAFFFVLNRAGWTYGQPLAPQNPLYLQATTACMSAIIVMQIVNVYLCRSVTRSIFSTGVFGNWLIMSGVILEITVLILINHSAWANFTLGTAPIVGSAWLFIIPFAAAMLFLEELRKWLARETTA